MEFKTVGYYKEMPHGKDTDNSILDFINKESQDNIDMIYQYLKSGVEFIVSPEVTHDIISPEKGTSGTVLSPFYFVVSAKLVSDGVLRGAGMMKQFMEQKNVEIPFWSSYEG